MLTLVLVPVMYALLAPEHFVASHGAAGKPPADGRLPIDGAVSLPPQPAAAPGRA